MILKLLFINVQRKIKAFVRCHATVIEQKPTLTIQATFKTCLVYDHEISTKFTLYLLVTNIDLALANNKQTYIIDT